MSDSYLFGAALTADALVLYALWVRLPGPWLGIAAVLGAAISGYVGGRFLKDAYSIGKRLTDDRCEM